MKSSQLIAIYLLHALTRTECQIQNATCGLLDLSDVDSRLTNAFNATHHWPWHAAMYHQLNESDRNYRCGGTLISARLVLTAAHCLFVRNVQLNADEVTISLGRLHLDKIENSTQWFGASEIFIHPNYNKTEYDSDIAIISLSDDAILNKYVQPICLWKSDFSEVVGKTGTVVGWGLTQNGTLSTVLQQGHFPVQDFFTCVKKDPAYFGQYLTKTNFCGGNANGSITISRGGIGEQISLEFIFLGTALCQGDSGGSITFKEDGIYYIRGIISLGQAKPNPITQQLECDSMQYAIFTDVAKFLPWITEKSAVIKTFSRDRPEPVSGLPIAVTAKTDFSICGQLSPSPMPQSYRAHHWPWHAAIFHEDGESDARYRCGGTIIDSRSILTSAQCVQIDANKISVHLGRLNLGANENNAQTFGVAEIIVNPDFDQETLNNDIAIIKLSTDAIFNSNVRPICLWNSSYTDLSEIVGKSGTVVGWGQTETGQLSNILQNATFSVVGVFTCLRSDHEMGFYLYENNFCAGPRSGTKTCNCDTGGSMTFDENGTYYISGIVSIGQRKPGPIAQKFDCDLLKYPVFTDVAKFLPWIIDNTSGNREKTTVEPENSTAEPEKTSAEKTTSAPKKTTVEPKPTTVKPKHTTVATKETTAAPKQTSSTPKPTTVAPKLTTVAPKQATVTPKQTTIALEQTTIAPKLTTIAPKLTTIALEQTTIAPKLTTIALEQTTVAHEQTAVTPEQTTVAPKQTTATPKQTTATPKQTTIAPKLTTIALEQTIVAPEQTTVTPEQILIAPNPTTVTPKQTTATPKQTTATPKQTTATPKHTTATPKHTTATPKQTTVVPEPSSELLAPLFGNNFSIQRTTDNENVCTPACTNGGTCISYNFCECPKGFAGEQCQYSVDRCALQKIGFNGAINCTYGSIEMRCKLSCPLGVQFDYPPTEDYVCKFETGTFLPLRVPKCVYGPGVQVIQGTPFGSNYGISDQTTCYPPCMNGGSCKFNNFCECPKNFVGEQCQYSVDRCAPQKLGFNGSVKCLGNSTSTNCRLSCPIGVEFNSPPASVYTCSFHTGIFTPSIVPQCNYVTCHLPCKNGGTCIYRDTCECPKGYVGPQCQYSVDRCALQKIGFNGAINCTYGSTEMRCTLSCSPGVQFDYPPTEDYVCKFETGTFLPLRVPKCVYGEGVQVIQRTSFGSNDVIGNQATCNPPCMNGGSCIFRDQCQCTENYRGLQCQYHKERCSLRKTGFNGGYRCSGSYTESNCAIDCPFGTYFEFLPAANYLCRYETGRFEPSAIPKCIAPEGVQIVPST